MNDEKEIEWRVKAHQKKIIFLSDSIADQLNEQDILNVNAVTDHNSWTNLFKIIYTSLMELLTFIETSYTGYLDRYAKTPVSYLLAARTTFDQRLQVVHRKLTAAGINTQLLNIILQPFLQFISEASVPQITYHSLHYLKMLLKRLEALAADMTADTDINKQIQDALLELNFNSAAYYKYCTTSIKEEIEALPFNERLERLIWMQKQISQIPVKPGLVYSPLDNSLHKHLQNWLAAEMNYLKELSQFTPDSQNMDEIMRWKGFKVLMRISVPQLGNMIKLLMDTGIFLNENKTELLEFYSYFYSTVQQDNISPGSLRKNFYAEDAAVADGVRSILHQLIDHSKGGLS